MRYQGIQPNVWFAAGRPARPYPAGWRRGFFTPRWKLTAKAYLPGPRDRAEIAGGGTVEPYWHVLTFAPASRASSDGQVLPIGEMAVVALMANTDQAGLSFQAQLFQVASADSGHRWSRAGVNFANLFGSAQRPFMLRRPYFPPHLRPLLARVSNSTTSTNNIQLVAFGLRRRGVGPPTGREWPASLAAHKRGQQPQKMSWIDMPAGGEPYRELNASQVVLPAIGAEATVVSFTVPAGRNGVIQQIANQFVGGGWTEGTGDIVWRIEVDDVAVKGFNSILGSLGSLVNPADLRAAPVRVREGQRVALICRNVNVVVAGQSLLGMLAGFFYPLSQETEGTWL